jgi:polar amino acid transport system substrate-binding protein
VVVLRMILRENMKLYGIVLILCGLSAAGFAETIQIVTGNGYYPFADEALPQGGMSTEIITRAFREVGYQPEIIFRPWKRGYEETRKGLFAATFPYIKTEERLQDFYYSDPIDSVYTRVFVRKDSSIQTLEDLEGKRICVPLGYGVAKKFESLIKTNKLRREGNPVELVHCLKMLQSSRKDFFVINEITAWITIQNTFHTRAYFRALDAVVAEESHHLMISKTYPDGEKILQRFNTGLKRLKDKNILPAVRGRHLKGILN